MWFSFFSSQSCSPDSLVWAVCFIQVILFQNFKITLILQRPRVLHKLSHPFQLCDVQLGKFELSLFGFPVDWKKLCGHLAILRLMLHCRTQRTKTVVWHFDRRLALFLKCKWSEMIFFKQTPGRPGELDPLFSKQVRHCMKTSTTKVGQATESLPRTTMHNPITPRK